MKKAIVIFVSVTSILVISIFIYSYIGFNQMREGSGAALRTFDPSTEAGRVSINRRVKIWEKVNQENIAREYYEKGDYDRAIKEYKRAIEMSKYDQWEPRYELLEVYEKAGYHDLAIQEINWLLFRRPSQQVIYELINRKRNLESLLKDSIKRINIIDGVTEKSYIINEMGKPDEILNLKEDKEVWIYKEYMDINKTMPHITKRQPFIIIFDRNNVVVENYITDTNSIKVLRKESSK